jgi:hypothetical protein
MCIVCIVGDRCTSRLWGYLLTGGCGNGAAYISYTILSHLGCMFSFLGYSFTIRQVALLSNCRINLQRPESAAPSCRLEAGSLPTVLLVLLWDSDNVVFLPRVASWLHVLILRLLFHHTTSGTPVLIVVSICRRPEASIRSSLLQYPPAGWMPTTRRLHSSARNIFYSPLYCSTIRLPVCLTRVQFPTLLDFPQNKSRGRFDTSNQTFP